VVEEISKPLSDAPKMITGSKPLDNHNYVFSDDERLDFLAKEPNAEGLLHPYLGAEEYINGWNRWVLNFDGVSAATLRKLPHVLKRIAAESMAKEQRE
jgi:hypothetical protein